MKIFLATNVVALMLIGMHQQASPPIASEIDATPIPLVDFGIDPVATAPAGVNYTPVIGLREGMIPPQNSTHIAYIDANCITGGKNCKVRINFWQIGQ